MQYTQFIVDIIGGILPKIKKIRHKLHSVPELGFQEERTAEILIRELQNFGYRDVVRMACTGVVAVLDSTRPGKTVALRVEMDALPIQEPELAPNRSKHDGVMHACGHDGHMAILLATAAVLMETLIKYQNLFNGKIKFIFQPAEEISQGSEKMIANLALENPRVDAIYGFHNISRYNEGLFVVSSRCATSGGATFKINVHGKGGYVSSKHKLCNPIYVGSIIVQSINDIASRIISPSEPAIVEITKFYSKGFEDGVKDRIPDMVEICGAIRTISEESKLKIKNAIIKLVNGIATAFDMVVENTFGTDIHPGFNNPYETTLMLNTAKKILGEKRVKTIDDPIMSPEDFSNYLKEVPGCFFLIGNGSENGVLHEDKYKFNDNIIPDSVQVLSEIAIEYLKS